MDEWFCWRDPDATAVQLHLIIHTTPVDVSSLRNDPTVPPRCSVYVAEEDALVPPAQQEAVAVRLGTTNVLRLRSGHMIGWEEVCVWWGKGRRCWEVYTTARLAFHAGLPALLAISATPFGHLLHHDCQIQLVGRFAFCFEKGGFCPHIFPPAPYSCIAIFQALFGNFPGIFQAFCGL